MLSGVTRSLALEVAEPLLPVRRAAIRSDELPLVAEAFVTSVSREVLPVVRIDGRPAGRRPRRPEDAGDHGRRSPRSWPGSARASRPSSDSTTSIGQSTYRSARG